MNKRLSPKDIPNLIKLIAYSEGLAELLYQDKKITTEVYSKVKNLILSLGRLNKKGLNNTFIRYISAHELKALDELITLTEQLIETGQREHKVSVAYIEKWRQLVNEFKMH